MRLVGQVHNLRYRGGEKRGRSMQSLIRWAVGVPPNRLPQTRQTPPSPKALTNGKTYGILLCVEEAVNSFR